MIRTEVELLARCKKGDIKSCQLLYDRYSQAMYHTCLRIVGNETDAEDILQEIFMEAFTGIGRLKELEAFPGWLKRIAINKSLNYVKRNKGIYLEFNEAEMGNLPEETALDEQGFQLQVEAVQQALGTLPDKHRTVISLYLFEDMSFEEIAILIGVPSATIRSQYLRGRQKILKIVTNQAEHGK